MTSTTEFWDPAYDNDTAPWLIGEPQPAIVELEREKWIRGKVLDSGTGAGEHTILLTKLGYDVLGADFSPSAVQYARRNAAVQGVLARFEVADALHFGDRSEWAGHPAGSAPLFDTVVDSALFHVFGTEPQTRAAYVDSLHTVCKPGGLVHLVALSDTEPGIGPRISDVVIRESFGAGWELEELRPTRYRARFPEDAPEELARVPIPRNGIGDFAAWLARIRRL